MEYQIIRKSNIYDFQRTVTNAIQEGWEPLGGVAVEHVWEKESSELYTFFCQAMIKE